MAEIKEELLVKRDAIECNWIFSLYKNISAIGDYKIDPSEDLITEDGKFYYGLANALFKAGYTVIDNMSIYTYIEDKKTIKKMFEERGGYQTIKDITDCINDSNIDAYYDELIKSNLLIRLDKAGFNVVQNLDKFKNMDSEQVYSFYEYQLANIATGKIEKMQFEDLTTGYDEYIEQWDKSGQVGFKISSNMLNYQLLGVHKKNLLLHATGIGNGKTTSAISWYILPVIETQDVCIIANEQDASEWRQMILATVLFNKLGTKIDGFSRHHMMLGNYSEEHKNKMREAAIWLESQPGKIVFVETQDYSINNIKKIMKRQSALGCGLFVVDTLKPQNDASDRAWGEFSEVAKELFIQGKQLDVAVIATCQLSPEAMSRKYLDLTCIGKSKAIAETASQVVMFRSLTEDEKEKLKAFNYEGKIKKEIPLNKDKDYIMVFTPKNRFGQTTPQIIMERNMNFNTYKDVGWINCQYDQFRTK